MARHMHVGLSHHDPRIAGAMRGLLAAKRNYRVTTLGPDLRLGDSAGAASWRRDAAAFAGIDVLLVGAKELARIEKGDPRRFAEMRRRTAVVLVLGIEDVLDATELLHACDSLVFQDANLGHLGAIVDLAVRGYFVVPSQLMRNLDLAGDRLRRVLLLQLSAAERQVFELIGHGYTNERIARELRMTEAAAKKVVLKVLKHLHFRNRVQAAVFAARERRAGSARAKPFNGSVYFPTAWRQ